MRAKPRGAPQAPAQGPGDLLRRTGRPRSGRRHEPAQLGAEALPHGLEAADPEAAAALMDALGIEEVPYGRLDLTIGAVDRDREERGLPPLA